MHAFLFESKRAQYHAISDEECMQALKLLCKEEGIIAAIESSHALVFLEKLCPTLKKKSVIVINLSGRGDKDMQTIRDYKKRVIYGWF